MRLVRRLSTTTVLPVLASALTVTSWPVAGVASATDTPPAETRPFVVDESMHVPTSTTDPAWLDPSVTVPPATTVDVDVPASGWARAGSLPVSVGAPSAGVAATRVRVRMLSQSEVAAAGGRLLGFQLSRADGGDAPGAVAVSVDYSGVAQAFGGDFASRLRLVRVVDCGAGAPCRPPVAGAANDPVARSLRSSSVPVAPDAANGPARDSGYGAQPSDASSLLGVPSTTTFVASSGGSGPNGDYTASRLTPGDTWDVGVGSGAFTYSYPFSVPPPPAGAPPALSLDYSSQSVDGRSSAANGQVSQVGEGWSMEPGFIERRFHSCADETNTADLCWSSGNEYFLHFGGHSGELVRNAGTNEWRVAGNDPAWRVLSFTGATNGDNDGEYFVLITPDGTKYWFGYGVEPRTGVGTNAAWEVPIYGSSGEPCYSAVATASWCQQTYRWNVDRIVDLDDNLSSFFYGKEYNYYARQATTALATRYVRSGYLARIEYGQRATDTASGVTSARVLVTNQERCATQSASCATPTMSSPASDYPDVPLDLMCTATSCPTSNASPTFWSTKQIASVATQYWDTSISPANFDTASIWAMTYTFPPTGDGTTPSLWLADVTHTGYYGAGSVALPGMQMGSNGPQANRVNTGAGVPPLNKYRVELLNTELGAQLGVTYGRPDPCPVGTWVPSDSNAYDCYPAWYDPHDGFSAAGFVAFHKYVVTDVTTTDLRGGQPTRATHYAYLDTPAWHYQDSLTAAHQSWSDYRGYGSVQVTVAGNATSVGTDTRYTLFRGMYGDHLASGATRTTSLTDSTGATYNDYLSRAGLPLEVQSWDATLGMFATTLHRYWAQLTVNGPNLYQSHDANFIREATTIERVKNTTTGAWRNRERRMTYSVNTSMPLTTSDDAMPGTTADDTCAKIGYVTNAASGTADTSEWIVAAPTRTVTYSLACEATGGTLLDKTEYVYDNHAFEAVPTRANVTSTLAYVDATTTAVTKTGYDALGRVTSTVSPDEVAAGTNGATTTAYLPAGSKGYPYGGVVTTNVLGQASSVLPYFAFGSPRTTTDANGNTTSYAVDQLGRVTSVTRPDDVAGTPSVTFAYNVVANSPNRITTSRLTTGSTYVTSYEYVDGLGRTIQTQERPANDSGTGRRLTLTGYDPFGRVSSQSQPFSATGTPGASLAVVDPTAVPFETRYKHDSAGRVYWTAQHAADVLQFATRNTFDGWGYTVDAPVRGDVKVVTDVLGRNTSVSELGLAAPVTTTYGYTLLGDLASVTDNAGNVTSYSYDWLRRRVSSADPDQGTWTTAYDADGNVTAVTDAKLATVTTSYDRLDRRTATSVGGVVQATWAYDSGATNAVGRLTAATRKAPGGDYVNAVTAYDKRGRVTGRRWTVPAAEGLGGPYAYTYAYDSSDALVSTTLPAAGPLPVETVTTTRNAAGLPTSVLGMGGYITGTTYAGDGRVQSRVLAGGTTRSFTYDSAAGRLAGIQSSAEHIAYTYDDASNVTAVTDQFAGAGGGPQQECFGYDPLNRLTSAYTTSAASCPGSGPDGTGAEPYDQTYAYDSLGDLTALTSSGVSAAYTYGVAGHAHAVATVGGAVYSYDANGATTNRPTTGGAQTLTWNTDHQLASVAGPGATSYLYDADGARLIRTTGTTKTLYLDGMEVTSNSGTVTATRYYAGYAMRGPGGVNVLLHNSQGSTVASIDAGVGVIRTQHYTPFGARRGTTALPATDRRFLGQPEDATGLVATGARYYDPSLGRFLSVDPLSDLDHPQSLAGYSYALNNPTSLSDPSGLAAITGDATGSGDGTCVAAQSCSSDWDKATAPNPNPLPSPTPTPRASTSRGGPSLGDVLRWGFKVYKTSLKIAPGGPMVLSAMDHGAGCFNQNKGDCGWFFVDLVGIGLSVVPAVGEAGQAAEAAEAAKAADAGAGGSKPFVMGIKDHLSEFAEAHGGTTWKSLPESQLGGDAWKSGVIRMLSDPGQRVLVNLDGVDVWEGLTRAAAGKGGATDWELLQLRYGNFPNIEFWQNGAQVGSPFG